MPGEFNRSNAAMALTALHCVGVDLEEAVRRVNAIHSVVGRFSVRRWNGHILRLLLAKNPSGFAAMMATLPDDGADVWVAINARVADGHDPSWLYDAPFEMLRGHQVYCFGDRRLDLATRLDYGQVDFVVVDDEETVPTSKETISLLANYTAFSDWLGEVRAVTTICALYPDLLGTYGDGGQRPRPRRTRAATRPRRGVGQRHARMTEVPDGVAVPAGRGRGRAATTGGRPAAVVVLRVSECATVPTCWRSAPGLQILGLSFCVEGDDEFEGLGLVDVVTSRGERRSVGELATRVEGQVLVGFENHGGRTTLHGGVRALGMVTKGRGNDGKLDGYRTKNIWATYAHGPVLAMNPWLCDEILAAVLGVELEPLASVADALYQERCRVLSS